ncbi:MAG: CBS domain-containing protein [Candidatus Polarisedimenticolaceae bacterium]|nr:CBS domain-containing protein [Candidatus Polarisedimenticolaceae bacterium]
MKLLDIVVPTGVAKHGMSIGQAFEACVSAGVPGVPYMGKEGAIEGRFSIRHILKSTCVPDYMIELAHLLGDEIHHATMPAVEICAVLNLPVESLILKNSACVSPESPVDKALAIMEQTNSSYIFLMDGHTYIGVVTRMGIAALMLKHQESLFSGTC